VRVLLMSDLDQQPPSVSRRKATPTSHRQLARTPSVGITMVFRICFGEHHRQLVDATSTGRCSRVAAKHIDDE